MSPAELQVFHITDVANLPGIISAGGLRSESAMSAVAHSVIGYEHIKARRLREIQVPCCRGRFVGEFVPFYFCPRSPMLYVINRGNTGRPAGYQRRIVHLVSRVAVGIAQGREWAISDGNAGAAYPSFYSDFQAGIAAVDWTAVRAHDWRGKTNQKSAEFLVADWFPWSGFEMIGCIDSTIAAEVAGILRSSPHQPTVSVQRGWYY